MFHLDMVFGFVLAQHTLATVVGWTTWARNPVACGINGSQGEG